MRSVGASHATYRERSNEAEYESSGRHFSTRPTGVCVSELLVFAHLDTPGCTRGAARRGADVVCTDREGGRHTALVSLFPRLHLTLCSRQQPHGACVWCDTDRGYQIVERYAAPTYLLLVREGTSHRCACK